MLGLVGAMAAWADPDLPADATERLENGQIWVEHTRTDESGGSVRAETLTAFNAEEISAILARSQQSP